MFARSMVGFLLGFSLASSYAAFHLLDEYKQASTILQASVEELQATATKASGSHPSIISISQIEQVSTHLKRIESVEKDLKALSETTVDKDDAVHLRAEVKKLYDGLHIGSSLRLLWTPSSPLISHEEFLDLRSHVWGIRRFIRRPVVNRQLTTTIWDPNQNKIFNLFQKKSEVPFGLSNRSCFDHCVPLFFPIVLETSCPPLVDAS